MAGWAWRAGKLRTVWTVGLVGFPITLLALLGTGQRGPLVLAFAAILFGVMAIRRLRVGAVAVSGAVILVLFGVFSSYLGRIRVFSFNSVALEFTKRLFVEEQSAGLTAFRYVRARDVVWFREWGAGFLGLLPSNRGSDLDSRLFALIHGSTRGNTTPSTIASVYHNGGLVMVPIVFMVLGFAYTFAYSRFLSGPRTIARCLTYGAMFFYLASWVGGAPVSLINKGVVTLIAVLAICKVRVVVSAPSVPRFTPAARGVPVAPRL
jgi:oligosaccharide repeat unit polymerase